MCNRVLNRIRQVFLIMRSVFARLFATGSQRFDPAEVMGAVDGLIQQVEPRLKLLPTGRRQLRKGVRSVLERIDDIAGLLPPALDLSPAGYSSDRRVGLLFASPQSLCDSLRASEALQAYLSSPRSSEQMQVMLVMQRHEETRLGSQLLPDGTVRSDVPQQVLSFSRHRIIAASGAREQLVTYCRQQAYQALCANLAANLAGAEAQRRLLEVERKALQLQLGNRTNVLNAEALNLHGSMSHEQMAARLADVEQQLDKLQVVASLEGKLGLLRKVVEAPEQVVQASLQTAWVDRMGVVQPPEAGGQQLDYADVALGYLQKRERVVFVGSLSRHDLREWQARWPAAD